ncbi:hypothetical protein J2Y69_001132 [Microbacterium resistens]|uniref:Uncharacterized protein n=1 Tax=Microbacterium resistens TaxID=156977 RepID=A0ABU1SAD1_9MICO|nr:hypothetical protein [Microbacterium resistens]MDR6866539.1 hypothetical protein [Microbacterium resistens]
MNITDTSARSDAPLTWKQAADDVFVATREGEFAGFVTIEPHAHILHDQHSRRVGSYPTLAAARAALIDDPRPKARRRGAQQARRRRRRPAA